MSTVLLRSKFFWLFVCIAFAAHLALVALINLSFLYSPQPSPDPFRVTVQEAQHPAYAQALLADSFLFDSSPLFLPTRWNLSSDLENVASLQTATEVFGPYPPFLEISGTQLPPLLQSPVVSLEPILIGSNDFYFQPLNYRTSVAPSLDGNGQPVLLLRRVEDGAKISAGIELSWELLKIDPPQRLWGPFAAFLLAGERRLLSDPILSRSTGNLIWDETILSALARPDIAARLPDGYYLIQIFPD